jgi:hypothetical protein
MTRVGVYPKNKRPRNGRLRALRALLTPCKISLFLPEISLLPKIFSLLICVGNLPKSGCGTGVFRTEIASRIPKTAKFPVNFPDSRELQVETGSYLAAHTTTHSRNFAFSETSREKAAFAGVV